MAKKALNLNPQALATLTRNKRAKAERHAKRMVEQKNKVLAVPRGTARSKVVGPDTDVRQHKTPLWTTTIAEAMTRISVKPTAFTEQGQNIASNISTALHRKIGVSQVRHNINLTRRTYLALKATDGLPAYMM